MQNNILITKSKYTAPELLNDLKNYNLNPIYLELVAVKALAKINLDIKLDDIDIFIFISKASIQNFIEKFNGEGISALNKSTLAAIGKTTAGLIQSYLKNNKEIIYPDENYYTSEYLFKKLKTLNLANKNIAIVKGIGGRDYLHQNLTSHGARVFETVVYERFLPKNSMKDFVTIFENNIINSMLVTCNTGLENLAALAKLQNVNIKQTVIIVISERIAMSAKKLGFQKVLIINNISAKEISLNLTQGLNQ